MEKRGPNALAVGNALLSPSLAQEKDKAQKGKVLKGGGPTPRRQNMENPYLATSRSSRLMRISVSPCCRQRDVELLGKKSAERNGVPVGPLCKIHVELIDSLI